MTRAPSPATVDVELRIDVDGHPHTARAPMPTGPRPTRALLPLMRAVVDVVVDDSAARSAAQGRPVRCAKGCSACCRAQPVPVTPPEAHAIAAWVHAQPTERRAELERRFADRVARLEATGLRAVFAREAPLADAGEAAQAAQAYQRLGLVCPFLEDDACSIHAERPFVCRLYLVTSDPVHCATPPPRPVEVLPMPIRPASALLQAESGPATPPPRTVPLVLALEHARRHAEPPPADAQVTLQRWLAALAVRGAPR